MVVLQNLSVMFTISKFPLDACSMDTTSPPLTVFKVTSLCFLHGITLNVALLTEAFTSLKEANLCGYYGLSGEQGLPSSFVYSGTFYGV